MAFIVIFFVALFVWQIERYLRAGQDSKLQGQITKMNLMIEADSLEALPEQKFGYLHSPQDVAKPWSTESTRVNFKPDRTLAGLFVRNHFQPSAPDHRSCYLYLYFPPGEAQAQFDFYPDQKPAYVLAGWSRHQEVPVVASTPALNAWARSVLEAKHFECEAKTLRPNQIATLNDGTQLDLPGYDFQFADLYYSKVKQ